MKLIDLLVKELPKQGGWPEKAALCIYYGGGQDVVYFWTEENNKACQPKKMRIPSVIIYDEITKEQYEAALAASKQHEWDGEGLPPVGCECEALYDSCDKIWFRARIIAHDDKRIIGRWLEGSKADQLLDYPVIDSFRPILTEAERKRDEAKNVIAELCRSSASNGHSADLIYDAIAAGKIPGIRLTDDAGN